MNSLARPLKHYPPDLDPGSRSKRLCFDASPTFTASLESEDLECDSQARNGEAHRHRDRSSSGGVICFGMVSTTSGIPSLI